MNRILTAMFLVLGCGAATAAPDYSGRWEFAVREFGQKNYYLPLTDGRLVIVLKEGQATATSGHLSLSGPAAKDGLHLTCLDGATPAGRWCCISPRTAWPARAICWAFP